MTTKIEKPSEMKPGKRYRITQEVDALEKMAGGAYARVDFDGRIRNIYDSDQVVHIEELPDPIPPIPDEGTVLKIQSRSDSGDDYAPWNTWKTPGSGMKDVRFVTIRKAYGARLRPWDEVTQTHTGWDNLWKYYEVIGVYEKVGDSLGVEG
jgi:hypothetical protein